MSTKNKLLLIIYFFLKNGIDQMEGYNHHYQEKQC